MTIMENLQKIASDLLAGGRVQVVVGFGSGSAGTVRAQFARTPADAATLIYDDRCTLNLAVYLMKHEVRHLGKIAVVANTPTLRAIMQLASEHQIKDGEVTVLAVHNGQVKDLTTFAAIEEHLKSVPTGLSAADKAKLAEIEAMTPEKRWQFWQTELARCFKCYACRATCPMCYCTRCTVEMNQPQWIMAPAHKMGNLEWHVMRAMHLAGRCVECGECGRACPLGLPIHLLTYKMAEEARAQFGDLAGMSASAQSTMSTFKPDDKESFIR
jgi:formate dehydrogenase (coenzyme F420) beta subunit